LTVRILLFSILSIVILTAICFAEDTNALSNSYQERAYYLIPEIDLSEIGEPNNSSIIKNQSKPLEFCQSNNSHEVHAGFEDLKEAREIDVIPDPIEPLNRIFFQFNDRLYFWLLKPIAIGYKKVFPQPIRICVRNFFSNLTMPIRAVNCVLQGDINGFGTELARFFLNSTVGMLGLSDVAKHAFNLKEQDEDLGQTFGFFGIGPGIYIVWPILGPSSLRDTVGWVGDGFLNPLNYIVDDIKYNIATRGYDMVNMTSLSLGEYESLKKAALDPYISLRDAYYQYRKMKIKE